MIPIPVDRDDQAGALELDGRCAATNGQKVTFAVYTSATLAMLSFHVYA